MVLAVATMAIMATMAAATSAFAPFAPAGATSRLQRALPLARPPTALCAKKGKSVKAGKKTAASGGGFGSGGSGKSEAKQTGLAATRRQHERLGAIRDEGGSVANVHVRGSPDSEWKLVGEVAAATADGLKAAVHVQKPLIFEYVAAAATAYRCWAAPGGLPTTALRTVVHFPLFLSPSLSGMPSPCTRSLCCRNRRPSRRASSPSQAMRSRSSPSRTSSST